MNNKKIIKNGLNFGIGMTVFFILQNLLINENHTTNQVLKSIITGIAAGLLSGVLFGWLIGFFIKSKVVTQSTMIDIDPDEKIVFETPANHFKGIEGVGGKLYLTTKRLI